MSADGRIVTVLSAMLEDPNLRVVLADGRRFPAKVVARDEIRQLAELKIDTADLPHFSTGGSAHLQPGDWLIAAANPFKVADGPETVSVAYGVLAERTDLAARLRTQDFPYRGPVLLTDVIVSSPGSAGGALVDIEGKLVGVIGRAVTSTKTNTFANYAMPIEEVAAFLDRQPAAGANVAPGSNAGRADAGPVGGRDAPPNTATQPTRTLAGDFGIRLLDVGGRTRPAYVERVRGQSPAGKAGLKADDLILSINNQAVATCSDAEAALLKADVRKPIVVVAKRREEVHTIEIILGEARP
jgi:serine protease Do